MDWSARDIKRDREGRAYTDDPEDMFPACQRCHRIYDKARKGLSEVGLIQLRGQLWESIPDEVRAAHQKSLQHKRAAYLRYKYKVDEVVDRRVRVMGNE
ncbi:hypothetical protein G3I48_34770 [Streptomyces griseus]|uniref:hypothetical protein n=1 Tax=Streptomyces griseus TaxID=1911 RepID=UPI0013B76578|nr:hypothetical protein [Streptomyces griseus]